MIYYLAFIDKKLKKIFNIPRNSSIYIRSQNPIKTIEILNTFIFQRKIMSTINPSSKTRVAT